MQMTVLPMLAPHRAVLELPPSERREAILQMLTPFAHLLKIMVRPGTDPITMLGLMRPDGPEAEYRSALDRLTAANAEETCRAALERAQQAMSATGYTPPIDNIHFGLFLLESNPMLMKLS